MRRNNMKQQKNKLVLSLMIMAMTLFALAGAAQAAGKYVTVAGGGDGSSFQSAMTLTAAIAAGNATTPIYIQAGIYNITSEITLSTDVKVYGGFAGTETLPADRTGGPGVDNVTVLNGQNQRRIMTVGNCEVLLDRLSFENGKAIAANGGALFFELYQGDPTSLIVDCTFKNNVASAPLLDDDAPAPFISNGGGAAYIAGNNGPTFIGCDFLNNEATLGHGGAIHWNNTSPDFSIDCHFEGNKAGGNGGAISQHGWGNLQVLSCTFVNNFAAKKGGAIGSTEFPQWHIHAENCVFLNNTAATEAGALYTNQVKSMRLIHNTFHGNSTTNGTTDGAFVLTLNNTNEFREDGRDRKYQPILANNLFSGHLKLAADITHPDNSDPGPSEINSNIFVGGVADGGANGYLIHQRPNNLFPPLNMFLLSGTAADYYVSANPQTAADLDLSSTSPAIDKGLADSTALVWFKEDTLSLYTDILGRSRFDGLPDVGAYEFEKTNEYPTDNSDDVPVDAILEWSPGLSAVKYNVYLGTDTSDVSQATVDDPRGVLVSPNQADTTYVPTVNLEWNTTYYWRVDEVNAPPDSTVFEGKIWSFTTEPAGYPIDGANITATASSSAANRGPENTVNGSGLTGDLHSIETQAIWLSDFAGPQPTWIQFEFDKSYTLHEAWVWNSNANMEASLGFGARDVTIEYSVDGIDYATLGTTHEFNQGPGAPYYAHNTAVDFGGLMAKYVRFTVNSNWGDLVPQFGLSEVRFFYIPVQAREPYPDSGATDVDMDVTLSWRAGREAAEHNVYLSTDEQAVIDGSAPVTVVAETIHSPSPLDLDSTYYWRVNEVNDAETLTIWQGDLWSFSTQESLVVEDFESYKDIEAGQEGSNLIYLTWSDGFDNPTVNGSAMGYTVPFEPTMETGTVHGGDQSAPLQYDNATAAFSEVTRTLAAQDWTTNGIQTLSLWFFGDPANTPGQLYVKINGVKVNYNDDSAKLGRPLWHRWNIDLASVGTNLQSVTSLAIGVEGPGATGTLLLDDIGLYRLVSGAAKQIYLEAEAGTLGARWRTYIDPASEKTRDCP